MELGQGENPVIPDKLPIKITDLCMKNQVKFYGYEFFLPE